MDGPTSTEPIVEDPCISEHPPPAKIVGGGGVETQTVHNKTPEELVAKAIAPVKREYLRPPPQRHHSDGNRAVTGVQNDDAAEAKSNPLLKEKKSKRQLKRERLQCACSYSDKCRFNHDVDAFNAQKPADIEGTCPFLDNEGPCPYGLACRFAGTHKDDLPVETLNSRRQCYSELNVLSKETQKLLWKNKLKFTKAHATLKHLGITRHGINDKFSNQEEDDQIDTNGSSTTDNNEAPADANIKLESSLLVTGEEGLDDAAVIEDDRPQKKAKSSINETPTFIDVNNASNIQEKDLQKSHDGDASVGTATVDHPAAETDKSLKVHPREKKLIDFKEKLYLAPLTTVGNLPFRRVCKVLGADVTCGEMAMCTNLLQGQASEWALLRRHSSEEFFGVQICGSYPDTVARTVELIEQECSVDFIDINMGCPIDIVVRTGYFEGKNRIHSLIADIRNCGATAVTIHGRSRQQRYSKLADWGYIYQCAKTAPKSLQVLGNGDVFSYVDWNKHKTDCPELSTCMIARGALIKPWIFTEIKEQRHWDISSGERLDILKDYVRFGLQHWGSDSKGVETTRHFLLEWLSYTCRYIPVGLLDVIPQRINWRSPAYFGRDDLETLMASDSAADWIRISELLLGKVPEGFSFAPKHKSNAYDTAENG
nr:tRNA-dihydrouridine(47) synthase [NAD(P)(+)]-like [Ipomoea batatas]